VDAVDRNAHASRARISGLLLAVLYEIPSSPHFHAHNPHPTEGYSMPAKHTCILAIILTTSLLSFLPAQAQQPAPDYTPALDVTSMDRTVDPCADFFAYSCGGWIKRNPIPPDQSSWDTYSKMQDENLGRLRGILEAAATPRPNRDAVDQKIGDYYASCTDEKTIDARSTDPLKPALDRISQINSKAEIATAAAAMIDDNVLFRFESIQDYRDASQVIANTDQGGLGLPDRDYYTKTDAKSVELRKAYVAHVQKMFELLGDKPDTAAAEAQTVMRIETALAKGSMTRVERRDPKALDHKMTTADLEKLSPQFQWLVYFAKVGLPSLSSLNVSSPAFFKTLERDSRIRKSGGLEDLPALASGARRRRPSVLAIPE
jgi:putative endopeptidase